MPSNSALTMEISKLSKSLGKDENVDGLSNAELAALLSDLKGKAKEVTMPEAKATQPASTALSEPPPILTDPVKVNSGGGSVVVAPGKTLTCKRGLLEEGAQVLPKHFGGGQASIDSLIKRGYLVQT